MKELSIEEKAYNGNYKAYTELINRLEDVKETIKKQNYGIAMDILCKPYPEFQITTSTELKESEDDVIRKAIVGYLKHLRGKHELFPDDWIAWLEKQGEQKSATDFSDLRTWKYIVDAVLTEENGIGNYLDRPDTEEIAKKLQERFGNVEQKPVFEMKTPEESLGVDSDTYNKIIDECIYGEQKPAEWTMDNIEELTEFENAMMHIGGSFFGEHQGLDPNDTFVVKEQAKILLEMAPKQEWSDADEEELELATGTLLNAGQSSSAQWVEDLSERLKSLRPQKQKEWTKGDIEMIDWLIRCCEKEHEELCNDKYGHQDIVSDLKRDCRKKWNWLESLKNKVVPQNTWKPSEEQILAINTAINVIGKGALNGKELIGLLEQLKAL